MYLRTRDLQSGVRLLKHGDIYPSLVSSFTLGDC